MITRNILLVCIVTLSGGTFYKLNIKTNVKKLARDTRFSLESILLKTKLDFLNADKISRYLSRSGVTYMFKHKIDPLIYLVLKIFSSLLVILLVANAKVTLLLIVPAGILGFFIPDFLFGVSNRVDNDEMLNDIKSIYDTLRIQTKAGVFLTTSLSECYLGVRNRRLKAALLELNSKIIAKNDIESAVDEFNLQFENKHIDVLCMILKQSLESGQSIQILSDLSVQMKDVQHAISLKEKEKLDRKIQLLQMMLYVGVLAICVYCLGVEITSTLRSF